MVQINDILTELSSGKYELDLQKIFKLSDYLKKNYCPFCYKATYISSRDNSDGIWCKDCKMKLERTNLLTKEEVRNKKIDEVLKK